MIQIPFPACGGRSGWGHPAATICGAGWQRARENGGGGGATRARAGQLRQSMTDAERLLWRELRRKTLGWRFRRQFPVPPYIVDCACIEARLIIEIDGGQHGAASDDAHCDDRLRRQGWRVLRFWNNEVFENRLGVLQAIADALGPWPSVYPHPGPPPQAGEGVPASTSRPKFPPLLGLDPEMAGES